MENLDFTTIQLNKPLPQSKVIDMFIDSIPKELIVAINKLYLKEFKGVHYVYIYINNIKKELETMNFDGSVEKLFTDGFFNLSYYYNQYGYKYKQDLNFSGKNNSIAGYITLEFYTNTQNSRK